MAHTPSDYSADSDHSDEISDHDESEGSVTEEEGNQFLDIEASEADSELASEAGSTWDDGVYLDSFPQFMQLPMELREMVWRFFCPDLSTEPRVFELSVTGVGSGVTLAPQVESQTTPIRTLLAVHHESRTIGHKFSPSLIELPHGSGVIPCQVDKDIILLTFAPDILREPRREVLSAVADLTSSFRNLAFTIDGARSLYDAQFFFESFPSLENVFILNEAEGQPTQNLAWCVSDKAHQYYVSTEEIEQGVGEDLEMTFCWPDIAKHRDFADEFPQLAEKGLLGKGEGINKFNNIPDWIWVYELLIMGQSTSSLDDEEEALEDEGNGDNVKAPSRKINVWPMAQFLFESGTQRLKAMEEWQLPWDEWVSDVDSSESDDTENEYDSEGIDDSEVNDHLSTDDEDDLPAHLLDDPDHILANPSEVNYFPSANFSSDSEPENDESDAASNAQSSDEEDLHIRSARPQRRVVESDPEDESTTEKEEVRPSKRRTRVVLEDSEEESDENENEIKPVPRGANRRARALPADSDDEDDDEDLPQTSRSANRRMRGAVPNDTDEEDEDEDNEASSAGKKRNTKKNDESSSDEDEDEEEEEEDSSDEEPAPAKRMSLAKRLNMEYGHTRAVRNTDDPTDDDDDSRSYSGASDDDDGDGGKSDGDSMVIGMDEDGEEDEDQRDMDGW